MTLLEQTAIKIPAEIRNVIREKNLIDKAVNNNAVNTPMEYLFDVYNEFIDMSGEYSNYQCMKCRGYVLDIFQKLKPYIYGNAG